MQTLKKIILTGFLLGIFALSASAQKVNISTDIITWANLGTVNAAFNVAVAKELTIGVSAEYNPWTFKRNSGKQFQDRRQTYALNLKWWPWHIYSGWWFGISGQYQEYNKGGMLSLRTEEGDAAGMALSFGHTFMLTKGINLDLGLGLWGGRKWYKEYACPRCGRITDQGTKWFILPNDISVALSFVF